MKNNFLLGALALILSIFPLSSNAQLQVLSSGNAKFANHVGINGSGAVDSVALGVSFTRKLQQAESVGTKYGVRSYVKTVSAGNCNYNNMVILKDMVAYME